MDDIKDYLTQRLNDLRQISAAEGDYITPTLGQIHEVKTILEWIKQHEEKEGKTPCKN